MITGFGGLLQIEADDNEERPSKDMAIREINLYGDKCTAIGAITRMSSATKLQTLFLQRRIVAGFENT